MSAKAKGPLAEPTKDDRCGTYAGALAHYRRRERPCLPCGVARSGYMTAHRTAHPEMHKSKFYPVELRDPSLLDVGAGGTFARSLRESA